MVKRKALEEEKRAEKQAIKDEKQRIKDEEKAKKDAYKQQLDEAKRRMTASKQELKEAAARAKAAKSSGAATAITFTDDKDTMKEAMTQVLQRSATAALQRDAVEARKMWELEPVAKRYIATKASRGTKDGYLAFDVGDLLIVMSDEDELYYGGRNVKTGKQGLFKKDAAIHCSMAK